MEWNEWKPFYEKILMDFGFSIRKDEESAILAVKIKKSNVSPKEIKKIIFNKIVSICGAGKKLKDEMNEMEGIIISADEATSILLDKKIFPDIITTDLDGNVDDILYANRKGSIAIIHAHGDNMKNLEEYLPKFSGKIMITTQSKPFNGIYNFGGFTDGDRAYCIAEHFKAKKIKLIGFDFENPAPKKGKNMEIKKRKLRWAEKIIENLREKKRL
ncbi:MAG TPA: DUF115 domain-containing protein [Thermoplasmata archaeon]|nr:DUF115 domain-containing protein [Thermoplasmata archaeon]